ncbi:MAG TPA: 4-hydroxy-tetrahydrodipicolinate synthase [Vicinamibacterales bacterium]
MQRSWSGVGTALVTPFTAAGALDEPAFRRLVERQIEGGVHFLVPCGTTGETPTLSATERDRVVSITVEMAAGRVPVLAGVGGYDTEGVAAQAAHVERLGVQGLLSVTPYYNKPTQEGLFRHYERIASRTSLPIIVYNVPGRTGCNVEPRTLVRLTAIDNIVGVKEASGNMSQICEVCRAVPDTFSVLCGDDALALPSMAVGARGVISVASNVVPERMARMVDRALAGDFAGARAEHQALLPLMLVNFIESNPIPVKAALAMLGLCEEVYRLPLVPPSDASRGRIREVLSSLGLAVHAH